MKTCQLCNEPVLRRAIRSGTSTACIMTKSDPQTKTFFYDNEFECEELCYFHQKKHFGFFDLPASYFHRGHLVNHQEDGNNQLRECSQEEYLHVANSRRQTP